MLTGNIKYAPRMKLARHITKQINFWVVTLQAFGRLGAFNLTYSDIMHMINCMAHTKPMKKNTPPIPA